MRHIDLLLQKRDLSHLNCELSVKIHAWLMTRLDKALSDRLHISEDIRPFSLFTFVQQQDIALRLSLLHETAAPLLDAVRAQRYLDISGIKGSLAIQERIEKPAISIRQLRKPAPQEFSILFASPASYRHNKQPSNLYALPPLLYTVAEKLRQFESIDIPNEEISAICDPVTYVQYEIHSTGYQIKPGITRPSFEGKLILRPGGSMKQRNQLALLIRYAQYAGWGAKTALGMGGIFLAEA